MSSDLVDFACIAAAILLLLFPHPLVQLVLFGALGVQMAGWAVSTKVPK